MSTGPISVQIPAALVSSVFRRRMYDNDYHSASHHTLSLFLSIKIEVSSFLAKKGYCADMHDDEDAKDAFCKSFGA